MNKEINNKYGSQTKEYDKRVQLVLSLQAP